MLSSLINPIFAFHPAPWQKSASDCFKHFRSLVQPSSSNRSTLLHNPCAAPKPILNRYYQKILSVCRGAWRLSLIKSVSEQARARVHTYHQKIVYVDMLQREESRSLPNNSKSFLYHRPKTSKSKIRSDNFHLQMRNEVCVDNSDIFTSFNVC